MCQWAHIEEVFEELPDIFQEYRKMMVCYANIQPYNQLRRILENMAGSIAKQVYHCFRNTVIFIELQSELVTWAK